MVLLAGFAAASGCRSADAQGVRRDRAQPGVAAQRPVVIDGRTDEWPARVATMADEDFIYFRVAVEGQDAPLQSSPESLSLLVDLDSRAETGLRLREPAEAAGLGVDLVVEFSPRTGGGRGASGVAVHAVNADGSRTALRAADVDLVAAPTHGAPVYEIRVGRHVDSGVAARLSELMRGRSQAAAMYTLTAGDGEIVGWSDPERFTMPPASARAPLADEVVAVKPAGAIRVLSYNVYNSRLMEEHSPFQRIFQVAQPDIILLQEWDVDEPTAKAWFTALVTGEHAWHVATRGKDVVIVSPHPISAMSPDVVMTSASPGAEAREVRVIGAMVHTPLGDVAAASLHLKCCGTAGSAEDSRRISEARAISSQLGSTIMQSGARFTVVGGDVNLVGTRTPLDMLRVRMDVDGSELAVAEPMVMGDGAMYTWRDRQTPFPPGRLDYILYSDSSARVVNAFVIETPRLTERALARMGLDAGDTRASDHLPVVVDLVPR
jgi:exonuclease III